MALTNEGASTKETEEKLGLFEQSLNLSNSEIKKLRASGLISESETIYRRKLEDRKMKIASLYRELDQKLDLNATDANSLIKGANFDAEKFYDSDESIIITISNEEKLLKLMASRYGKLFNKNFEV